MKSILLAVVLGVVVTATGPSAQAQLKIIANIDTAFAHGGKVEVPLSAFGDEVTDFYGVFPDVQTTSKITVCGKVGTADPSFYKIGLIQLNPLGSFDASFGIDGKVITSWGVSSYPNRMYVSPIDSSIIISGMSASSTDYRDHLASLFKFRKNGSIDSTFGGDGHVAIRFDASYAGEFVNIYPVDTTYLACGTVSTQSSVIGVCAMRFFRNGTLDSTYGNKGKGFIPVNMESVTGFLSPDASLTLIGAEIPTDSEPPIIKHIILARFKPNGMPDSSFGKYGVVRSGVVIGRNSVAAAIQPNYDIVAAYTPPEISLSIPWKVVRFNIDGSLDTLYGDKGYVTIGFGPGSSETRGVNIAKNGKATVNGSVSYGQGACATARINPDGSPDITFNQIGNAVVDVDSGRYANYLLKFVGIGNKKYCGVGGSIHNGLSQFLIAKFKDDTLPTVSVAASDPSEVSFQIYPNPASSGFTIQTENRSISTLILVDELGRRIQIACEQNVSSGSQKFMFDSSTLPNGHYHCIIESEGKKVVKELVILH